MVTIVPDPWPEIDVGEAPTAEVGVEVLDGPELLPPLLEVVLSPLRPTPATAPALGPEFGGIRWIRGCCAARLLGTAVVAATGIVLAHLEGL